MSGSHRLGFGLVSLVLLVACVAVWFQRWSLDGLAGVALTFLNHDTAYADGYSDERFRSIQIGMTLKEVRERLGEPLKLSWTYTVSRHQGCVLIHLKDGRVQPWVFNRCATLGIRMGQSGDDVARILGAPDEEYWIYSESPGDTHYRERVIRLSQSKVVDVISGWYLD